MYETKPVAIITGGAKGIGRETAAQFLGQGYRVVVCGRDAEALSHIENSMSTSDREFLAIQADVRNAEACENLIQTTIQSFGRIDVLVNNAGMAMRGSFEDTSSRVFRDLIEINYLGAVTMTKAALPYLLDSHGSVIFISSLAGLFGLPQVSAYSASKMVLTALAQSMQCEFHRRLSVGILYVSFTENDPGKKIYLADGSLGSLVRSRNVSSQTQVAKTIYSMVRWKRKRKVMSFLGVIADSAFRFAPRTLGFLIRTFGARSKIGGSVEL